MGVAPLTDDTLNEAVAAYKAAGGNQAEAARNLDIPSSTMKARMRVAARRGFLGYKPVLDGFEIAKVSSTLDANGNLKASHIQQKPERDLSPFGLPAGHVIKGVSALVDANGNVMQSWYKTKEGERDPTETARIIEAAFENFTPSAPYIITPTETSSEKLAVYVLCDWHVGLFAYGKETGGPDWDLNIAKTVLLETMSEVVDQSPKSKQAIILGLGDLLHADNARNMTERSNNVLDVDTRYSKCLETVCDLVAETSEMIASKHEIVEATFKRGNHDENSTAGIAQALRMYFRNTARVSVDTSPNPFFYTRFGVNLIGGTHGDKAKMPDLPLIMANHRKDDWASSSTRHFHTGHIHHDSSREIGGVTVFSHRAPTAQDAWHAGMGFLSGRSIKCFNYHADKGSRGSTEVEIK